MLVALGGFWFLGWGILGILILALWIVGIVDITKRPDLDRGHRAAWILIVVLLPVVGTILYLAMRPTLPDEREQIVAAHSRRHR